MGERGRTLTKTGRREGQRNTQRAREWGVCTTSLAIDVSLDFTGKKLSYSESGKPEQLINVLQL